MLELKFIRENRELVKEMLANRNSNIDLTEFDKLDEERKKRCFSNNRRDGKSFCSNKRT